MAPYGAAECSKKFGASDEARTRYLHLGKVALYQMSYTRNNSDYYNRESKNVKYKMKKILGEAFPISGGRWHGVAMTDETNYEKSSGKR